jgi:hypothetical protein
MLYVRPDLFRSARNKIARAKEHIVDLDAEIRRFVDENPHKVIIEDDAESGYKIHKVVLPARLPASLALIASDAVTNLRAALDHIGYSVAVASGIQDPKWGYHFPFADTAAKFNQYVAEDKLSCRKLPDQIQSIFKRFQPYQDGNTFLWALNEIRNRDNHAVVMPTCIARNFMHVTHSGGIESPRHPFWDGDKNEMELFRSKSDVQYDLKLVLDVGFDGPEAMHSQPMVETLNIFVNLVEEILGRVEQQSQILGLIR